MNLQDILALSIVFGVSGIFFYKRYFARNKLKTCGSCSQCPSTQSLEPSTKWCSTPVELTGILSRK